MRPVIAVIGGGKCTDTIGRLAEDLGECIAKKGAILICGGLSGVMEAACRGARSAGGLTIGVLPGSDRREANEFVDIPIVTGMADARNIIIVRTADAVIAVDGEYGTLSEIAFALKFSKPVIGLQTWDVSPDIVRAATPQAAVDKAFEIMHKWK